MIILHFHLQPQFIYELFHIKLHIKRLVTYRKLAIHFGRYVQD